MSDGDRTGHELSRAVIRFHAAAAQRLGLNLTEHKALGEIATAAAPVTPTELAQRLGLTRPAVTKIVDRLVTAGLVRREPDPRDGRSTRLRPDDLPTAALEDVYGGLTARMLNLAATFDPAEAAAIARWITGAVAALDQEASRLEGSQGFACW